MNNRNPDTYLRLQLEDAPVQHIALPERKRLRNLSSLPLPSQTLTNLSKNDTPHGDKSETACGLATGLSREHGEKTAGEIFLGHKVAEEFTRLNVFNMTLRQESCCKKDYHVARFTPVGAGVFVAFL
jgi:hypothetical protein